MNLNNGETQANLQNENVLDIDNDPFTVNSVSFSPNDFNDSMEKILPNSLSISHTNIRSLKRNFDAFKELFEYDLKSSFNVIALSEIWNIRDVEQYNISGYNLELQCRMAQRGGGVGAYVHTSFDYKRISNWSLSNAESLWLKINIKNMYIIVGVVYRKPGSNLEEFSDDLNRLLQNMNLDRSPCIIVGDLNINLLSQHDKSKDFLRMTESYGLRQLITDPTRVTNTTSSLIDHIYTNISSHNIQSGCIVVEISDHFPVFAIFENLNCVEVKKKRITRRNFRNFSLDSFLTDLRNKQWLDVYKCSDANEAYNNFLSQFLIVCDKHAPSETISIQLKKKSNPWITRAIKRSITRKHKLYGRVVKSNFNKDCLDKYKKYRNVLTTVLRTAKQMYYNNQFERDKKDSKKTWKHINELLNKKCSVQNDMKVEELVRNESNENVKVTSSNDIANTFNDFFVQVGENLAKKIVDTNDNDSYKEYLGPHRDETFFLSPVTTSEVNSLIGTLDRAKASGYDDLTVRLLVDARDYVSEPLAYILNLSFSTGIFPDKLKVARVVPIFKKGDKTAPGNYRPISVLPVISKLFEKLINTRIVKYFEENDIFYEHQYGFRHGYSTKLSLINLINQITQYTDEGRATIGVFIDFAKAFDTINHSILFKKLEHYGIRGIVLQLFKNYLTNRKQFVVYDDMKSTHKSITCGVPQGSVLGPTLFLLYINDLPNSSKYFNFRLFADDSNLFHTFKLNEGNIDLTDVSRNLQAVVSWCNSNKLTINVNKTKYILFKNRRKTLRVSGQLLVSKTILESVESTYFLGICIDKNLTWKKHIDNVCNMLSKKVGMLYRIRNFVSRNILITLYNAFILPHITYGLEVWGASLKTFLNPILLLQKRISRVITFKEYTHHSAPLFFELKILDVFKQYRYQICIFMHDLINSRLPHTVIDYCSFLEHPYDTRNKEKGNLKVEKVHTNIGKQSISYSGSFNWNKLPVNFKNITRRNMFCRVLKQELLKEY